MSMSVFTDAEIAYLNDQRLGALAHGGADGMPHVIPVAIFHDPQTQTLVIGSNAQLADMAATKKFRDAQRRPKVAGGVDDRGPRFIEVRGDAETYTEGGEDIGKRLGAPFRFSPSWIRVRPRRIVALGIEGAPFARSARDVCPALRDRAIPATEGTASMSALSDAIERGWAAARRDDPEPTVGYFRDLARQHPGDAHALFEYAGALDFAGREAEAAPVYEQAFSAGLDGDSLRRGLIQYGSTLRNLGRFDEAVQIMRRADEQFPGHDSVAAFLALALTSAGRCQEAVARLIVLALDRIGGEDLGNYEWALRNYAAELSG